MTTINRYMNNNILALAVRSALMIMFTLPMISQAEEVAVDETTVLTHPTNSIEFGITGVSDSSAKFGEYNGLDKSGAYGIANINIRGGQGYEQGDNNMRWQVKGVDLGTTSRAISGLLSNQGQWDLSIGYDELDHNITNTYQTPQQGSMGGNTFTLPADFGYINAGTSQNSARVLTSTQLGELHTEKVGTSRKNTSFGFGYVFSPELSFKLDFNHLDQSGAKLISVANQGLTALGSSTGRTEAINIMMNPTNYTTDTIDLAIKWVGEKWHLSGGYFGSYFRDEYNSFTSQNALATGNPGSGTGTFNTNTMSTAPDNNFHQLNLTGGYSLTPATKLAGGLSYGRNYQNDNYASAVMQSSGLPQASLDGLVVNTHADFKLTNQTSKNLILSAGLKYNERDNRTASNTYNYINIGNVNETVTSTPMSNRKTEFGLGGDYRLSNSQKINVAYEHDWFKRWCDSYLTNGNNPNGAECAVSPSNYEDKLGITYKLSVSEDVKFKVGYNYADRTSAFNHSAVTPLGATVSTGVINAADLAGFIPAFEASRTQNMLKAGADWQVSDKVSLGLNGRYSKDDYNDSPLGVKDGRSAAINLDATYSFSDQGAVSAYLGWQNRNRDLSSAQAASNASSMTTLAALSAVTITGIWTDKLTDDSKSIGFTANKSGLLGGKLDVDADLSYSIDKTGYSTKVPYNSACATTAVYTCADLPNITSQLIALKLSSKYQIDKHGKIGLGYRFQHLISDDYFYNAYQYGYTPNRVMPTNQQSGSYSVNVVTATYTYTF